MNAATQYLTHSEGTHSRPFGHDASVINIARVAKLLRQWRELAKQRRQLAGLSRRQLDDVGISVEAAAAEASKPFWRA